MSHFTRVDDNDFVAEVIRITQDMVDTGHWGAPANFVQTSFNTRGGIHYADDGQPSADQSKALRKNYAGIGFKLDRERNAFIPPKDYPSWVLNEDSCLWQAPVPKPEGNYVWNEPTLSWQEVT
jgi:hypothetical protein